MWESVVGFFLIPLVMWLFIGFISGAFFYAVEKDSYFMAGLLTVWAILVYQAQLLTILSNWQMIVFVGILYIIGGALFSGIRWWRHCKHFIKDYPKERVENIISKQGVYKQFETVEDYYKDLLNVSDNKSRLFGWALLWPWGLVWLVIRELVYGAINSMTAVYNKITDSLIKSALK